MTAAKEVKQLISPLHARHPEMALVGKAIIVGPVRHLLHTIYIDRASSADVCQPPWGITRLFLQLHDMQLGKGDRLHGLWRLSDPGLPERLIAEVESIALPKLTPDAVSPRAVNRYRTISAGADDRPARRRATLAKSRKAFAS